MPDEWPPLSADESFVTPGDVAGSEDDELAFTEVDFDRDNEHPVIRSAEARAMTQAKRFIEAKPLLCEFAASSDGCRAARSLTAYDRAQQWPRRALPSKL
jgi:hypothetical protein